MSLPRLHIVTNDAVLAQPGFATTASRLLEAGGRAVALHVRGHATPGGTLFRITEALAGSARASGALLLVNDRIDVACCAGAHGVQLGRRSIAAGGARTLMPDGVIGFSAHGAAECAAAERDGVDFVVIGTVFASSSHPEAVTGGVALVDDALSTVRIPVIAIGGITPVDVGRLAARGTHGIAVLSGVWNGSEPVRGLQTWLKAVDAAPWASPQPAAARTG